MIQFLKFTLQQAQLGLPGFFPLFELGLLPVYLLSQHRVAFLESLLVFLDHLDQLGAKRLGCCHERHLLALLSRLCKEALLVCSQIDFGLFQLEKLLLQVCDLVCILLRQALL